MLRGRLTGHPVRSKFMSDLQSGAMHQEITPQPALPPDDSAFRVSSCSSCGEGMALRNVRDYGMPDDRPRRVMRVVWWECRCGHREVIAQDVLS
jgi:hypothetical protein